MNQKNTITLAHGSGGKLTHNLIQEIFRPAFQTKEESYSDSAVLPFPSDKLVFTTDSHVVSPIFFPGGNIGHLAVNGTVNDISVMGAKPLYLSCGFIMEEGLPLDELKQIVESMAEAADKAGVRIVTGDTKVVERNAADKIFINTAGVGYLLDNFPKGIHTIEDGDVVIVSGTIGDHGVAIYAGREGINIDTDISTDCACVFPLVEIALKISDSIRVMRDPTRGGLGTTLNEFVHGTKFCIEIEEQKIPIRDGVRGVCELLGFDPLYLANEGKMVMLVKEKDAQNLVDELRKHPLGTNSAIIGRVNQKYSGRIYLKTVTGGERIVDMPMSDMLPRIC